jgi:hypothetical protein
MTPLDLLSILAKVAGSRTAWARMPSGVECGSKGRENGNRKIVQNVVFVLGPWINPTDLVAVIELPRLRVLSGLPICA